MILHQMVNTWVSGSGQHESSEPLGRVVMALEDGGVVVEIFSLGRVVRIPGSELVAADDYMAVIRSRIEMELGRVIRERFPAMPRHSHPFGSGLRPTWWARLMEESWM